jgi:hypothetical protein
MFKNPSYFESIRIGAIQLSRPEIKIAEILSDDRDPTAQSFRT